MPMPTQADPDPSTPVQNVTVTYDPDVNTLTVDMDPITLESETTVNWIFHNLSAVPASFGPVIPSILFDSGDVPPDATLGPFQCLQVENGVIQGKGNVGCPSEPMPFTYTARLLNQTNAPTTSPTFTVINAMQSRNSSPECAVDITVDDSGKVSLPQPDNLLLAKGDTAIWHITNLQPQQSVSIIFDTFANPLTGPFESIAMYRGLLADDAQQEEMRVLGINFDGGDANQITYSVAVRDATGLVLGSGEPIIDNLGQPPTPPIDPIEPGQPPYHWGRKT